MRTSRSSPLSPIPLSLPPGFPNLSCLLFAKSAPKSTGAQPPSLPPPLLNFLGPSCFRSQPTTTDFLFDIISLVERFSVAPTFPVIPSPPSLTLLTVCGSPFFSRCMSSVRHSLRVQEEVPPSAISRKSRAVHPLSLFHPSLFFFFALLFSSLPDLFVLLGTLIGIRISFLPQLSALFPVFPQRAPASFLPPSPFLLPQLFSATREDFTLFSSWRLPLSSFPSHPTNPSFSLLILLQIGAIQFHGFQEISWRVCLNSWPPSTFFRFFHPLA